MGNHAPCGTEQAVVKSDGRVSMYFVTNMGRSFQAGDNGQEASSRANGKDQESMARIFISCRRAISITRLPSLTALSLPLRAEIRHDRNAKSGDVYFIESAIRRMCSSPQVTFSRSFEVEAFPNNHQNGKGELAVGQLTGPARSASRLMALSNFSTITSPRSSKWSGILCAASALASDHYELRRFP